MKSVKFVVHCYAAKYPHYAALLRQQIASLAVGEQVCRVSVDVWCSLGVDAVTRRTAREIGEKHGQVEVAWIDVPTEQLFTRAFGRNASALDSETDLVWFIDADYWFAGGDIWATGGALAALVRLDLDDDVIYFPGEVAISRDHREGNRVINAIAKAPLSQLPYTGGEYVARRERLAIGGLQIVTGATARKFGYCDGTRFALPTKSDRFLDTKCDIRYRKTVGQTEAVAIPGVHRIRHVTSEFSECKLDQIHPGETVTTARGTRGVVLEVRGRDLLVEFGDGSRAVVAGSDIVAVTLRAALRLPPNA